MTKTVTHIDCPKEWGISDDFSSHRPLLWLALNNTDRNKNVFEFGMGFGSTRLIGKFCRPKNINCFSLESDDDWRVKVKSEIEEDYKFTTILFRGSAFGFAPFLRETGLVFIDHKPAEDRHLVLDEWADKSDIIVVHDTEPSAEYVYGMSEVLSKFKYRIDFRPEGLPHTTAVSNFINVTEWC